MCGTECKGGPLFVGVRAELLSLPSFLLLPSCFPFLPSSQQVFFIWMTTQAPERLQSDNGTEFCAQVMLQLCKLFGVQHVRGAVGHPQSQVCSCIVGRGSEAGCQLRELHNWWWEGGCW